NGRPSGAMSSRPIGPCRASGGSPVLLGPPRSTVHPLPDAAEPIPAISRANKPSSRNSSTDGRLQPSANGVHGTRADQGGMTSMHIPRIPGASRIDHAGALARRSPSARRFEVERLEARTALSGELQAGLTAMNSYRAEVAPAIIGSVDAAWTAHEAGVASPA